MPNKQIYLDQELFEYSKMESNFSNLVSRLYRDYINSKKSLQELKTEEEKLREEKQKLIDETDIELRKIELQVKKTEDEIEDSEKVKEEKAHKLANKISNCIQNTKEIFNIEITEEQAVEFLNGDYRDIAQYLLKKELISHENKEMFEVSKDN